MCGQDVLDLGSVMAGVLTLAGGGAWNKTTPKSIYGHFRVEIT